MSADDTWKTSRANSGFTEKRSDDRFCGTKIFTGPKSGNIVPGAFTPVLAKPSKSFSLIYCISVFRRQQKCSPLCSQADLRPLVVPLGCEDRE